MSQSPRLLLFCVYFGPLPSWFHLFLLSCGKNPGVDFILVSDQDPGPLPPNVRLHSLSFAEFRGLLGRRLGLRLEWTQAFKVCDVRPALGLLYEGELKAYSHWGYCDCDVIFGRIGRFYDEALLGHDVLSTRNWLLAGHFTVLRNCRELNALFTCAPDWRQVFESPDYLHFDEVRMAQMIYGPIDHRELKQAPQSFVEFTIGERTFKSLFREQYPTFLRPMLWRDGTFRKPGHWEWRDGVLRAPFLDNEEMLYLHFTHWCSARWTGQARSVWSELPSLVDPGLGRAPAAFSISARGFLPLAE